jgi:hypothetical protein
MPIGSSGEVIENKGISESRHADRDNDAAGLHTKAIVLPIL